MGKPLYSICLNLLTVKDKDDKQTGQDTSEKLSMSTCKRQFCRTDHKVELPLVMDTRIVYRSKVDDIKMPKNNECNGY